MPNEGRGKGRQGLPEKSPKQQKAEKERGGVPEDRDSRYRTKDGTAWKNLQATQPTEADTNEDGDIWVQSGRGEPELVSLEQATPRGRSHNHFWTGGDNYEPPEEEDEEPEEPEA